MSESVIIGVDHGYAAMKTAHFAFPSGLVAYEHEPYTLSNVLEYGGKFYVAGSGRQPLQKDKTQTEDYAGAGGRDQDERPDHSGTDGPWLNQRHRPSVLMVSSPSSFALRTRYLKYSTAARSSRFS